MKLSALDVTGFKSFAKHVHLDFQDGNTAIVGPNGSGKSNIADAIRWVLGEQSMKTLRGKKLEDVIYAGGVTKGRLGMAEVSLTLDNGGEQIIDAPEITVTRRLYRSGESAYLVNNRPVRLLDMAEILAKAGFAQKTYTVIGQGMADSFVNAAPMERRAMFEDATGVTPLLIKKEQTERKLEQTKENLIRAKDHLAELEPRLKSLKRQASRARQREETEKELRENERVWYSNLWHSFDETLREAAGKVAAIEEKITIARKNIASFAPKNGADGALEQLREARINLDKTRDEEQKITIALAKQGYDTEDYVDKTAEELKVKESELKRITYILAEARDERKKQETILRKIHEELRILQDRLLTLGANTAGKWQSADIRAKFQEILKMQEELVESLSAATDTDALASLAESAEKIRLMLAEVVKITDEKNNGVSTESRDEMQSALKKASVEKEALEKKITENKISEARLEMQIKNIEESVMMLKRKTVTVIGADENLAERLEQVTTRKEELAQTLARLEKIYFSSNEERLKRDAQLEKEREFLHTAEQEKYAIEIESAGVKARKEDIEKEMREHFGTILVPIPERNEGVDMGDLEREILGLRKKLELIGGIDPGVIKEEEEVDKRVTELSAQIDDLEKASADLRGGIKELNKHIHLQFSDGMKKINENFNEYFRQVFGGGRAALSVIKQQAVVHREIKEGEELAEEVIEEHTHELPAGVEIKANPPGKKLGSISQLSGGEKALTSVALLFSIISLRNSPFIVLDEVDAALDESNSRRFAGMLRELSKKTQFLVITHNRATMESANALYGVTMGDEGISQLLSVKLTEVPEEYVGQK